MQIRSSGFSKLPTGVNGSENSCLALCQPCNRLATCPGQSYLNNLLATISYDEMHFNLVVVQIRDFTLIMLTVPFVGGKLTRISSSTVFTWDRFLFF